MPRTFHGAGVNAETGEVIDITGQLAGTGRPHRKKQRRHKMFALVDSDYMSRLELTQQESRVFWAIAGALAKDSGSIAKIGTGVIAEQTGMLYSNVGAALASLKKRNIIARESVGVWVVSPWLMYAGSAEDWEAATADAPEPEWSRS